jgi:broad specificity phosphatase PhoE
MTDRPIVLYCARHGSTSLNGGAGGKDCFRGKVDVPLDKQGFADAHQLASLFSSIDLGFLVHSDRVRAAQTADVIAQRKEMDAQPTSSLRAWNVGCFSGKPKTPENEAAVEWYVDNPDEQIPEGESLNQFKARVRPAIWEAIEMSNHVGEPGLLVVHSSIIHEISSMFHNNHEAELVEPGGAVAIYLDPIKGLKSEAIFKSRKSAPSKADTVS